MFIGREMLDWRLKIRVFAGLLKSGGCVRAYDPSSETDTGEGHVGLRDCASLGVAPRVGAV